MPDDDYRKTEERMKDVIEATRREFASIRTGRANPALLDRVSVEAYGDIYPINQVASISVPEPRLLVIQPWDRTLVPSIERAILKSDLALTPMSDGSIIRIPIPALTEDRRRELVKMAKKIAEDMRVRIRNIRREAIDILREQEKNKEITEDDLRHGQEDIQKLTDRFIAEIDSLLEAKEAEITEF
ncbi:MAG: ribosome recycling factor [Bacillota bacterium]|jgi:ribosome recycling factor|nr:ribosome recycling factor [Bacillota bacterium]MDI9414565.1 ribosome recycling factor [Bacillota bacterium]NLD13359.1 ribosome recycling factor [Bacillota bacterium]HAV21257.1 ribosome recycling factor [Bacillota bacterium]HCD41684.1 ribosome recycling factor [Bacillota bacterium]